MLFSPDKIAEIERKIGYAFRDRSLLETCFTHASYANIHGLESYDRLEFLGDAILGFLVAEALYGGTEYDAGRMTEIRQQVVSEKPLRQIVEKSGLEEYMLCTGEEIRRGKAVSSLFEALTAGIYFDGGAEAARRFVLGHLAPYLKNAEQDCNYKGELQEFLQARGQERAVYTVIGREGAPHMPHFTVQADAAGESARGEGGSKAEAEKSAAKALLSKLRE